MIKSALEYLQSLARPAIVTADGRQYSPCQLNPVCPPAPEPIQLTTLTGLLDFIGTSEIEEYKPCILHVESPEKVRLLTGIIDSSWMSRWCFAEAKYQGKPFPFGTFIPIEDFIIGVNAQFQPTEDQKNMLALASNLTETSSRDLRDDGITQRTTVKKGITQVFETEIKNRVKLRPYRTFAEIEDQPQSEFVFRVRAGRDGGLPTVALFEADGGAWRAKAIQDVSGWVKANLKDKSIQVIA